MNLHRALFAACLLTASIASPLKAHAQLVPDDYAYIFGDSVGSAEEIIQNKDTPSVCYVHDAQAPGAKPGDECHAAETYRHNVVRGGTMWCAATECCHYEITISPNGHIRVTRVCEITEEHDCSRFMGPPPPPPRI